MSDGNACFVLTRPCFCLCSSRLRIRRVDVDYELLALFGVVDNLLQRVRELVEGVVEEVELEDVGVKKVRAVPDTLVYYVYILLVKRRDKDIVFVRKPDFEIARAARAIPDKILVLPVLAKREFKVMLRKLHPLLRSEERVLSLSHVLGNEQVEAIHDVFYGEEWMLGIGTSRRDDGRVRLDLFPAAAEGGSHGRSSSESFDPSGNAALVPLATGPDASVFEYARSLLRWRRETPVLHHGRTLQFVPQDNTYAYFRYDDATVVMVFLNLSETAVEVPWARFAEITDGLGSGRDPVSGETVEAGEPLTVRPLDARVLEFPRNNPNLQ